MKTVLLIFGSVVAIISIVPFFISDDSIIVRSIEVNAPVETVYNFVKDFNNYAKWNIWFQMVKQDTKQEISGPIGEVGSTWSWEGDTVGKGRRIKGRLIIEALEPNKGIQSKLIFLSPRESTAQDLWDFEMIDSSTTKITWTYAGKTDSYFMRYMNLAIDGYLGPMLELGLSNLKVLIEKLPQSDNITEGTTIEEQ